MFKYVCHVHRDIRSSLQRRDCNRKELKVPLEMASPACKLSTYSRKVPFECRVNQIGAFFVRKFGLPPNGALESEKQDS